MARILSFISVFLIFFLISQYSFAQTSNSQKVENLEKLVDVTSELEFKMSLEEYVKTLFVNYGADKIPEEYFLINLMHLVNKEFTRRLENPDKARQNYFSELNKMLDEIHVLKQRLQSAGITELKGFVSDLEARIKYTVNTSDINFKKKKVFEDALQLLYVAEEMIKLDQIQQAEQTGSLNEKITQSKKKLLTAFGEVTTGGISPVTGGSFTIYDLFEEWKKLDQKQYSLRLTDVELVRQNLIKATDSEGILRMLNDELKMAYDYFNQESYDQAERLLTDVLVTYPKWGVKNLDDVYYYQGECNFALDRLLRSQEIFEECLQSYPTTSFLPQIYKRLVQINYTFEKFDKTIEYADLYQNVSSQADPDYFDVQFLSGMANYQRGDLGKTIDLLSSIPESHPYYYFSLYFTANAYVESQKYDDAIANYLQVANNKKISPTLYNMALYKIGILEFERKNYFASVKYLTQIPESFNRYDKVLNALAWTFYETEQSKPSEIKDFSKAKFYANRLINEYYASPYQMEAKSMLAYISQLEDNPSNAMNLYRNVYQTKTTESKVIDYIKERENLDTKYQEAKELKAEAFRKGDKDQYIRAEKLTDQLKTEMLKMDLAEASGFGLNTYDELEKMISQLDELNRLRLIAESNNDQDALDKINNLHAHLSTVLDGFPPEMIKDAQKVHLLNEYPVSKLVAEEKSRQKELTDMRMEINDEMNKIQATLSDLENSIQQAKTSNDYKKVTGLEFQQKKFEELLKDDDNLLSSTYMLEFPDYGYPDFGKWGDFGAFGIINVQFYQRQKTQRQITQIASSLDKVNDDLDYRKQVIEDKIQKIEAEIRFMTMKARVEERTRLRAERERAFREGYFDTRTSETEQQ